MGLRKRIYLILLIFILLASNLNAQISTSQAFKFNRVMDLISMFYVDTIEEQQLIEKAIISVLKDLDPHSIYIKKEDVQEMNESLIGSFEGIGITYNILNDTAYIISTYPKGPSDKIGIKAGDRIIYIADEKVIGVDLNSQLIKEKLLGKKGSEISIKIKRKHIENLLEFTITRGKIPLKSIDAAYLINSNIAYVRLNKFAATTMDEFEKATKKLKKEGAKHIILDLRDNGGGYLRTAINLTDEFLDTKKLIVYTKGVSSPKSEYFSNSKGSFKDSKLVILINEGTASASEIVSGAIQDWDRGIIIGRRSFGKGLVQRPFNLVDGSIIRLTIARYYTPTGRLIQKTYKNGYDDYKNDISKRIEHGELYNADSINFVDSLKFITLKNKRTVFAGGGIMPDIFIPVDTTIFPPFYKKIIKSGSLYDFILHKIDIDREKITKAHPTFDSYKKKYVVNEKLFKELIEFCIIKELEKKISKEHLLEIDNDESVDLNKLFSKYNFNTPNIKNHIKALIARDLWGRQEYYEIINLRDKTVTKAIEVINDENLYSSILH